MVLSTENNILIKAGNLLLNFLT